MSCDLPTNRPTTSLTNSPRLTAACLAFGALLALACGATTTHAQTKSQRPSSQASAKSGAHSATPKPRVADTGAQQELEQLARALRDEPTGAQYERLSQFATREAETAIGARAALALGYYDFMRNHFPEARKWLEQAAADPLLGDYALYWRALNEQAAGANDVALAELKRYRQRYPDSAVSDAAVEALAKSALAVGQPDEAVAALDGYPATATKSSLVLLRAQAQEKAATAKNEIPLAATVDYLEVVYRFPLSDDAKTAADRILYLRPILGEQFPGTPLETEIARAEAFYDAKRWKDLRATYNELLPKLSGSQSERAKLRIAQANAQLGGGSDALASLTLNDPELDAERIYTLSQAQRSAKVENEMFASVEQLVLQHPQSPWAEQALFAAGNYDWVNLDRDHAVGYYQRVVAGFPAAVDTPVAQWRIVWTAYLERQTDVQVRLEQYLRQYPASSYTVDALYWLGRATEHNGNQARARSFYLKAVQRFPQTYFAEHAEQRLHEIGSEPVEPVEFLSLIPPAPPLVPFTDPLPAAAITSWARAQAFQSIAFENAAEIELRAGYIATHAPRLLLSAAQAAIGAGHYSVGIVTARQLVTNLDSRHFDDVPDEAWRAVYPLPFREPLEREAQVRHLDPMLVAGLIRQESAFASDAVSFTDCCFGLMQVKTSTGMTLARRLNVRFSHARLFDPEYNLRLGELYISSLLSSYPAPEFALAAYNAGEDRVAEWTTGQQYDEIPEFVESIPITQTRDYVQIVLRNAELYRQIYVHAAPAAVPPPKPKAKARVKAKASSH